MDTTRPIDKQILEHKKGKSNGFTLFNYINVYLEKERHTQGKFQKSELHTVWRMTCADMAAVVMEPVSLSSSSQSLCYHWLVQIYCLHGRIASGIGVGDENPRDSESLFLK